MNKYELLGHLLGEQGDEIPLQHWFEKCIDGAVLVVVHGHQQLLHELNLVLLCPARKILHADITLFQVSETAYF